MQFFPKVLITKYLFNKPVTNELLFNTSSCNRHFMQSQKVFLSVLNLQLFLNQRQYRISEWMENASISNAFHQSALVLSNVIKLLTLSSSNLTWLKCWKEVNSNPLIRVEGLFDHNERACWALNEHRIDGVLDADFRISFVLWQY